ncbi:hypothetical protein [Candidatus Magnetobacterium casense]|uniref:Uncharacterized protein n=1 Tax=Candidatus Magnetobacterium casense TaxID=1455061 RepID=A0ABS6RU07_9BACT|nr:hypothetical protein [Candidatus Magnetobacterium casensis]MBV6340111.1 hypothetical protein [Candidatus Magnetobacterium casensis]
MAKEEQKKDEVKMRQIIIETDGRNVKIIKAEVASEIEFVAILQAILTKIIQK